jgi:hypothetical protein
MMMMMMMMIVITEDNRRNKALAAGTRLAAKLCDFSGPSNNIA